MLKENALLLIMATAVIGCAKVDKHHNPRITDLSLDETVVPESVYANLPSAEPALSPPAQRAETASLWKTGSRGFFGDQRASRVGDILTVTIQIDDKASLENESSRKRSSSNSTGPVTILGYESKLGSILPGLTQDQVPTGRLVDVSGQSQASGEGSIERNEKISLKVAAMIMKTLPNDNFVIAGRQEVKVNNEIRELRVAGIIRAVDIDMNNAISYDKIAEARITYGGRGQVSKVQAPKYGNDLFETLSPY